MKPKKRWAGIFIEIELVDVDGVYGDVVAVRAVAGRRRCADVAAGAGVVDQGQRVSRQIAAFAGAGGQLGDRGGQVGHRPVPEARSRRGVRVVDRHGETACLVRKSRPGQLRADVLAARAHDPADLWRRQRLAVGERCRLQMKRRQRG